MWPRLRQAAAIAVRLLAPTLLSQDTATSSGGPVAAPTPQAHHHAGAATDKTVRAAQPQPFAFADVQQLAQERAAHEYRPIPDALPAALANLSYDQYRDIRFRPESALWRGQSLFEVQFFHRGYHVRQRVNIFEVTGAGASPVAYNPQFFTFGPLLRVPKTAANLGFAGLRVHYPLHSPAYKDELIVFLGASYFRVLGRHQHYGPSARALAIDTAAPGGEEFPAFTDFWLVRPQPADRVLTIYALLDGKSMAGAYQFQIRPGATQQVEGHCGLYPRRRLGHLGVAASTSLFLYGEEGAARRFDDYRPQVHDSDRLMTETRHGQWTRPPPAHPPARRVNPSHPDNPPR